ncbi:holo-ACP synthase [Clostridium sp. SHJSY1]|uniref:holo-ACP synthase n=1 Tax=Clostridium sp. SHJSY1 TaxID=2942483 RepID=UPI0028747074|nr:holo-ACP synthase [Clostridium sp. SHJSY1]MDS0526211.1 holo-ACP synthase [Clostridium sp. SHJSY1]
MIRGIGTDIVKVKRIEKIINRTPTFVEGAFTYVEICYFDSKKNKAESIAGMFAVKEAVSKAIGTGIRGFGLHDIEVIHDELGKPNINLSNKIIEKYNLENCKIHVTISHTNEDAVAFVVIEEVI